MLIAVVALFVVCWAPVLIDNVLTAFGMLPYIRTSNLKHMATAFHLMAYFNRLVPSSKTILGVRVNSFPSTI